MEWNEHSYNVLNSTVLQHTVCFCLQTKKSLPVYPYKEALIQAIREHQVKQQPQLTNKKQMALPVLLCEWGDL